MRFSNLDIICSVCGVSLTKKDFVELLYCNVVGEGRRDGCVAKKQADAAEGNYSIKPEKTDNSAAAATGRQETKQWHQRAPALQDAVITPAAFQRPFRAVAASIL